MLAPESNVALLSRTHGDTTPHASHEVCSTRAISTMPLVGEDVAEENVLATSPPICCVMTAKSWAGTRRDPKRKAAPLANPEEDNGWTVLATTVSPEVSTDAEILQAYQEQHTTVDPGFRWIKHPAAIAPVWLEKPERIAALAMLTVVGLLVYSVIQRQVRLSLRTHEQQLPGNKGMTAIPTAAVVLALFSQVALVQLWIDEVVQIAGV